MVNNKEKPILFKGPMVVGVLNDTKTQTRRVANKQECVHGPCRDGSFYWIPEGMHGDPEPNYPRVALVDKAPHQVGQRLWVRETFTCSAENEAMIYRADGERFYAATAAQRKWLWGKTVGQIIPSIFMPRWASRIDLEVTKVRAQLVQDISEADARAEGIYSEVILGVPPNPSQERWVAPGIKMTNHAGERDDHAPAHVNARGAFECLWNDINAKPKPVLVKKEIVSYISYPWEDVRETREHRGKPWLVVGNPTVFAYTFRRVRP